MQVNASSRRPGFSYLVGVTDKVKRRFRNFSDAASCGGEGTIGRLRYVEYEGGRGFDGLGDREV